MQPELFSPPAPKQQAIFVLEVPGRLPSWNEILGMEYWQRYKFKNELAADFLSALKASAAGCSTSTTSAKNTTAIYADTLAHYLKMRQELRKSKSRKRRLERRNRSSSGSKSIELGEKVPF